MDLLKALLASLDIKKLVMEELMLKVVKPKLDELAQASPNKIDDALLPLLYPLLEKSLGEFLDRELAKLK